MVFEQFFTDPPPKARVPKYLRPGPTSGGTLALSSSGGHPGPGVNVLLILDNFPAKNTKNGSGTKDFSNRRYSKDHPNVEGFILGFLVIWTTFALCNIFYLKSVWPHPQKASSIWNNSWISSIITVCTILYVFITFYITLYIILYIILYYNILYHLFFWYFIWYIILCISWYITKFSYIQLYYIYYYCLYYIYYYITYYCF